MTLSEQLTEFGNEYEKVKDRLSQLEFHKELEGSLIEKYIKCGKKDCPCNKGLLHGPYYYIKVNLNGKQVFQYIKKPELEKLLPLYKENREYKKTVAQLNKLEKQIRHINAVIKRNKIQELKVKGAAG